MRLCMGCMEQIDDSQDTCPHCGYNEKLEQREAYYLQPGTVVGGKYIVGKNLSYGGYSITYIGWDAEENRKIAIKEYLPSDFATRGVGENDITIYSGDALEQFERGLATFLNEGNEIQHMTDTTGIEKVYDCFTENDTGYIVTEYIVGTRLSEQLSIVTKYTVGQAIQLLSEVMIGLSNVHAVGIMHYDIAPENILLTNDGHTKLINFGAIRYITSSNSKSLAIILKPGYAPEEQYRTMGEKGPWSDVYAIAAVLYHMITGCIPEESVERAMQDNLNDPSKLGVTITSAEDNALMNAINVYHRERTQSMSLFYQELHSKSVKRIAVKKRHKESGKLPSGIKIALTIILACVVIGGGIAIFLLPTNKGKVKIEDNSNLIQICSVEGMNEKKAEEELKKLGFKKINMVYEYNPDVIEGNVTLQNPTAGQKRKANKKIVLTISGGKSKISMLDVTSMDEEDARVILRENGMPDERMVFVEGKEGDFSDVVPEGSILRQSVKIGDIVQLTDNTPISFTKSLGSEKDAKVEIPNLVQMTKDQLKKKKLPIKIVEENSDTVEKGKCISQDVKPGTVINTKTGNPRFATAVISKGPVLVVIPNVVGKTEQEAKSLLEAAGLQFKRNDEASSTIAVGSVIRQDATGKAPKGGIVTVTISKGYIMPSQPSQSTQPKPNTDNPNEPMIEDSLAD